ncbi:MAG: hypothetical protein EXS35_03125 [Pedosphaera sp.]|nr:hypothetical protein [Pedosphaera sp.]
MNRNGVRQKLERCPTEIGITVRQPPEYAFDRLRLESRYMKSIRSVCKVINEQDIWPLHEVRLLTEYARLVARRNKRFVVTKLGRELLADGRAGELFRRLFLTYFRTMDLCYLVHVREQPEIQATLAITLWRLEQVAENWRAVKGMAGQILPPRVMTHLVSQQWGDFDTPDFFVCAYVLQPLLEFGLLERRRESEWQIEENDTVRVTPLFRRFIGFAKIPSPMHN